MSYDVILTNAGEVDRFEEGGTYAVGGITDPQLNITYNYSHVYRLLDFSIKNLDRQRAGDWIDKMETIVEKCGTKQYDDYWAPTPGNAGYALNILLGWAKQYPDGIWEVI